MADNPYTVKVPNVFEALMAGEAGYKEGRGYLTEREQAAARQEASAALTSGDPNASRNALAKLLGANDIQGANALANFGNQTATQDYQRGMLSVAQQNANTTAAAAKNVVPHFTTVGAPGGLKQAVAYDPVAKTTTNIGQPMGEENKLLAGDRKAIYDSEDELGELKSTRQSLARAKELAPKAFTGPSSSSRATIGNALSGVGITSDYLDPGWSGAKATTELGQLLSEESIKSMSKTLKGATTDREMAEFQKLTADPNVPVDIKLKAIDRMMGKVDVKEKILGARMNQLRGGSYFKPTGGQSAPAGDSLSQARDAIARGAPREAVMQRLQQNGIDPAGL